MADQSAKPRQADAVVGQKRLEAQLTVASTDGRILLALPIRGYRQYQPIRPSCADFDTQQPHRLGVVLRIGLPLFLVVFGVQIVLKNEAGAV